jgi:hypothetical protein
LDVINFGIIDVFGFSQHFLVAFILAFFYGLGVSSFATALASEESKYIDKHHSHEGRVVESEWNFL